jgi:hypothetical protein
MSATALGARVEGRSSMDSKSEFQCYVYALIGAGRSRACPFACLSVKEDPH